MLRLPMVGSRARIIGACTAAVLMTTNVAWAQSGPPKVRIDSAPTRVGYENEIVIAAHVDNVGDARDAVVAVQRRDKTGEWSTLETRSPGSRGHFRFFLGEPHTTARYRLMLRDEASAQRWFSQVVEIEVAPRLTLRLGPDNLMAGRSTHISGRVQPAVAGRRVALEQRVAGRWHTLARARVGDGEFGFDLRPRHHGRRLVRVRFAGDERNASLDRSRLLMVYRGAPATWYGPGLYGNRTACGGRLTEETLGVAHRTLPCGTDVSILYRGRTITVPVIDRGPYNSADYDLTSRTARRLRFSGTDRIGVVTRS